MIVEAAAAAEYWQAWSSVPIPWVRADAARVPEHWQTVGGRRSPLTGNPRLAANPANAILNYLYAILEAEARLACLATGLDPGLGVLHADQRSRDSLALDVMEAVRPDVDAYLLELLRGSVFRAADFHETRQGVCRVLPPLTHDLASTGPRWARHLAPVVERVARALADGPTSRVDRLPTRLTQDNRSAGRDRVRRQPRRLLTAPEVHRSVCHGCGNELSGDGRWCDRCRPAVQALGSLERLTAARAHRAELRTVGRDPASSEAARAKLAAAKRRRWAEELAWDREHPEPTDPEVFRREILPQLADVPVRRLAALTGLSVSYCATIRRGEYTPHPRWWDEIRTAATLRQRSAPVMPLRG